MSGTHNDDTELWKHLKESDESAYATLFRKHYSALVSYGKSLTNHQNLVPDCVQEVFIEVWTYRQTLATPGSVKAYLLSAVRRRIARRIERDAVFRHPEEVKDTELSISFTVLDNMISDEETRIQVQQLNLLLNKLPERQKEVLYLRYNQGLEVNQISELMQINTQSVSNLLQRALKHLRGAWVGNISSLFFFFGLLS